MSIEALVDNIRSRDSLQSKYLERTKISQKIIREEEMLRV